jgi:hypothetical protein
MGSKATIYFFIFDVAKIKWNCTEKKVDGKLRQPDRMQQTHL